MALAYEAAKGLEFREIRDAQETFTSDAAGALLAAARGLTWGGKSNTKS